MKKLTQGISFFMTNAMFEEIQKASQEREVSISQLLRSLIKDFLVSENNKENNQEGDIRK